MSLVDALQVSPARTRRRKMTGGIGVCSPKMSVGVRVDVELIDGRRLEFNVGVRLFTQELMALVASQQGLRETHYFALAFRDHGKQKHWLIDDRRLLDHDFARGVRVLPLVFCVKFFPDSVSELRDSQAVELFYQHARNQIKKCPFEIDSEDAVRLSALSLLAENGEFTSISTSKVLLRKQFHIPLVARTDSQCEDRVCDCYEELGNLSRGDAILSYIKLVEAVPGYGVHLYEVRDRSNHPWYLGISQKGISQYEIVLDSDEILENYNPHLSNGIGKDFKDRRKSRSPSDGVIRQAKKTFCWEQLENLYFRDRKFSIEVHDSKRVSVSRRSFGPSNIEVYVWLCESQSLCKAIWSMAIAQHQFYLDAKSVRSKELGIREPPDLAGELSRSCLSLSTHSSSSNLSRSGSHSSLHHNSQTDSCSSESLHLARMELLSALHQRHSSLQEKLKEKTEELRILCMREGELTGELPVEYPLQRDESPPIVRKRVGTSFTLDEGLINRIINKPDESVTSLELEYDIQAKITCAALRLANESSQKKGVRRQRRQWHHMASMRLRDIEKRLNVARSRVGQMPKAKKKPRPISEGDVCDDMVSGSNGTSLSNGGMLGVEPLRDISMVDASLVSPSISMLHSTSSSLSAPPSPQRVAAHAIQGSGNDGRPGSPHRPMSGYIPSCVYTRNQYRSQHFPTLSTRGGSVPPNTNKPPVSMNHHTSFNGGLYNLPHQRTSLASHSLDDLDTSISSPPSSSSLTSTPPIVNIHQPQPPHHKHFHHHHHQRKRNNTTVIGEHHNTSDRYGSLDRRRATSGRLESRSMEHLDTLPPNSTNGHPKTPQNPLKESLPLTPHYPMQLSRYDYLNEPLEGSPYPTTPQYHNELNPNYPLNLSVAADVVDGPQFNCRPAQNDSLCSDVMTRQRLVRTPSGRSYMETTFVGEENIPPASSLPPLRASSQMQRKHDGNSTGLRPTASVNAADHLRPFRLAASDLIPLRATKSNSVLPPLKPTNGREDHASPGILKQTHPIENSYNHSNQSYSRLNGHAVNSKLQLPTSCSSSKTVQMQNGLLETSLSSPLNSSLSVAKHSMDNSINGSFDMSSLQKTPQGISVDVSQSHNYNLTPSPSLLKREPLLSLSEAAKLQKERWDKSKDADSRDRSYSNKNHEKDSRAKENVISSPQCFGDSIHHSSYRQPLGPHTVHNLSTSSVTSSSSNNSVFHSMTEGSDSLNSSLNATLTIESPRNQLMITSGSFQPPREITKPFEMSDFYKYSTKFRRQGSQGSTLNGSGSEGSGSDTPLSPVGVVNSPVCSKIIPPPSPSLIAASSSPAPQQKGVYTPLIPLSCKPMNGRNSPMHESSSQVAQNGSWEHTAMHQAVPVTVTNKRAATLV